MAHASADSPADDGPPSVTGHHGRVSALDGLRGVAVAAVLAYHGGVPLLPGGFLGVDVFFVLSGYLITTLLLAEWGRNGRVRLSAFWARRAKRLLPALVLLVVVVWVAAPIWTPPEALTGLRSDALATLAYCANWRMIWRGTDYFTQTAAPSLLQHMWSLGVEEQFYLLWPLVLLAVVRVGSGYGRPPVRVLAVAVAGLVASAVTCAVLSRSLQRAARAYFGSDTRAMSVLAGCALAAALAQWPQAAVRARRMLAGSAAVGAAAVACLCSRATGGDLWLYPAGFLGAALGTAAILAHAVIAPRSVTARLLSLPGLPALGRISYGVYLWHWPLFAWVNAARTGMAGSALFALRCVLTVMVAAASFVLLERPVQRGRAAWLRRPAPVLAGALALMVSAVAPVVFVPSGGPVAGVSPATPVDAGTPDQTGRSHDAVTPTPPISPGRRSPGQPISVVVTGDSIAWSLVRYLPPTPGVIVHDHTTLGCGLAVDGPYRYFGVEHDVARKCARWPARLQDAVRGDRPDVVVILAGRWETMDRTHEGKWTHLGDPAFDRYLSERLERAVAIASGSGARVLLATEPYNRRGERPDGGVWPEDRPERVDHWNALLRLTAARHPATVRLLDFGRRLCPDGTFTSRVNGVQVRSDGVHLTPEGVRFITPWLMAEITAAAAR
ncbi:acyltransferase family protein [Streptomyces sp. NPDC046557]|uniref:acyltransferase family protein n=1 Tax=Streptomyces sp. NPDC046557 TaxID=3155372 RepID=UPI0033D4C09E